jgi:hypothetical protein
MSQDLEIVPLFATPLVVHDVPDAAALNADLRRVIQEREKSHPGTQASNEGGWQSTWDMERWGRRAGTEASCDRSQRRQSHDGRPLGQCPAAGLIPACSR